MHFSKCIDIIANTSYRPGLIFLLIVATSLRPDGSDVKVLVSTSVKVHVVYIGDIEGIAHLITINLDNLNLVNNPIDVHALNKIQDSN